MEEMEIDLSLGMGEFLLGSGTPENVLIVGNITPEKFQDDYNDRTNKIVYRLEHNEPGFYPHTARWEINLTDALAGDLVLNNGAGEMILSLSGLDLMSLDVNQGVGRMVISLPKIDSDEVLVKQAIGTILVQIPDEINVAVDAQNGLSKVDFPGDFELEDGYYVSPGASRSNADLFIVVEQAIGLITFEYIR